MTYNQKRTYFICDENNKIEKIYHGQMKRVDEYVTKKDYPLKWFAVSNCLMEEEITFANLKVEDIFPETLFDMLS